MTTQPLQRKQILVVEDDADIRLFIARALEREHYAVHQAEHGQAALVALQRLTPDLIVSDIKMPRMDGVEFYRVVRQNARWVTIPFIFITANDAPEDIRAGRELGVEDYITKPVAIDELLAIVNARLLRAAEVQVAQVGRAYLETVSLLANTIEGRDPYTHGHVERVTAYARALADALGWAPENLRMLEFGARLHDIGKITIPDHILNKRGPLSEAEWNAMRLHPQAGTKILRGISHLQGSLPYVLYHHERWNGSGYPHGLRGKQIPVEGRVLAIVDVFDALTTARPYHPPRERTEVEGYLGQNAGKLFDPNLVTIFLNLLHDGQLA